MTSVVARGCSADLLDGVPWVTGALFANPRRRCRGGDGFASGAVTRQGSRCDRRYVPSASIAAVRARRHRADIVPFLPFGQRAPRRCDGSLLTLRHQASERETSTSSVGTGEDRSALRSARTIGTWPRRILSKRHASARGSPPRGRRDVRAAPRLHPRRPHRPPRGRTTKPSLSRHAR